MEDNNGTGQEQGNLPQEQKSSMASKAKNKATNVAANKLKNVLKKNAGKNALMKALAPILLKVGLVLLIIFIIIGIIMFLVTMPGMIMEKLKGLFAEIGSHIAAFFGADTTKQISEEDIYNVLDELEHMGYDLKGYGFLTDYVDKDSEGNLTDDDDDGVIRDDDDKIKEAESEYIKEYIISDNYIYTIKNNNLATSSETDGWFDGFVKKFSTAYYKVENFLWGPLFDFIGLTDDMVDSFGRGLLVIYKDTGTIGKKDSLLNNSLWSWDSVNIDPERKIMSITNEELFNSNNPIEYSMDGWTGRYGMPLEFLMSIHLATLMPGLAVDMATTFPTNVNVYLHEINGTATAAIKSRNDEFLDYNTLKDKGLIPFMVGSPVLSYDQEKLEKADELGLPHSGDCTCDLENHEYCDACKRNWASMISKVNSNTDTDLAAWQPYIVSVINHWYRDVYFVIDENEDDEHINRNPKRFVKMDYDYEALTKERWTLYETYGKDEERAGEFKLYKINEDGSYKKNSDGEYELFDGTKKQAEDAGIAVAKKAKTIKISNSDALEDLNWTYSNNIWSVYNQKDENTEGDFQSMYPEESDDTSTEETSDNSTETTSGETSDTSTEETSTESDDSSEEDESKSSVYAKTSTYYNVTQKGEGQRTATNKYIKQMFLTNKYFRYDGSAETAEIITKLRKKVLKKKEENASSYIMKDDPFSYYFKEAVPNEKDYMNTTAKIKDDKGNEKEHKVSDYVANVSLNQDSLNAFSMLENTHTLDADYIYRDFKELVVELGYFTKEELTDETPRLLQFAIPATGSYGYPRRRIDKNENEYGTVIHSKSDIDAIKLRESIEAEKGRDPAIDNVQSEPDDVDNENENNTNNTTTDSRRTTGEQSYLPNNKQDDLLAVHGKKENMMTSFDSDMRNNINNTVGDASEFKADTLLDTAKKCWSYIVDHGSEYSYGGASQPINNGNTVDCSSFVSWILLEYGFEEFKSHPHTSQSFYETDFNELYGWEEIPVGSGKSPIDQLQPGDIFVRYGGGTHHVTFVVEVDTSAQTIKCYDCGGKNNWTKPEAKGGNAIDRSYFLKKTGNGKIIRIENAQQNNGEKYNGYIGNEAVVSPVTGILLEYGEYKGEKDTVTDEEYRANIDYKYPLEEITAEGEDGDQENTNATNNANTTNNTSTANNTSGKQVSEADIPHDHVGYAKILVLDKKTYSQLEKQFSDDIKDINNDKGSLLDANNNYIDGLLKKEDDLDDWTDEQKTIYGYKEFAETYEKTGIAGHIVYVDGFKCEYPDEEYPTGDDSNDSEGGEKVKSDFLPEGDEITIDDAFKKNTYGNFSEDEDVIDTVYEPDEEYKMASKKATEKLNAESKVKEEAIQSFYTGNKVKVQLTEDGKDTSYDGIFLKEGTVIGRTMTDKELIDEVRSGKFGSYDELRGDGVEVEQKTQLIGNYIRVIMLDQNRDNVENVEDYMKLDDGEEDQTGDQEYQFQDGDLELLADAIHHELCGEGKEDGLYVATSMGYTIINKLNSDSNFPERNWEPNKSPLYNLVCQVPCAAHGGDGWYAISDQPEHTMGGLKNRADAGEYEYCDICMEAAKYIKQNDSMNFKHNGKFTDGGNCFSAGEGMPHTCWEQGGDEPGGKKLWLHYEDYLFDPSQ